MTIIQRSRYLQALIDRQHNGMVKVITGLRRVGKSFLLQKLYTDYLLSHGTARDQIITLSLDDDLMERYRDPHELSRYVRARILDERPYYLFIDELQYAMSAQELAGKTDHIAIYSVLNGLLRLENLDVYVTGSNSKFLSKDVLSDFRGRGDEIHLLPLTFKEFLSATPKDRYEGWQDYYTYGGLPQVCQMKTDEQKILFLKHLMETTYLADIIGRHHIANDQQLSELTDILASCIGSLVNPPRLARTFASIEKCSISENTIRKYLSFLEESSLIHEARRFDVKGRKYISSPAKYYFEDIGLRNARLGFRQTEANHIMENVIYNELRYRGFNVDVGVVPTAIRNNQGNYVQMQREVDFVAHQGPRRYYLQCTQTLTGEGKRQQETASLSLIPDSFRKIVITADNIKPTTDEQGIVYLNLSDFLLREDALTLF